MHGHLRSNSRGPDIVFNERLPIVTIDAIFEILRGTTPGSQNAQRSPHFGSQHFLSFSVVSDLAKSKCAPVIALRTTVFANVLALRLAPTASWREAGASHRCVTCAGIGGGSGGSASPNMSSEEMANGRALSCSGMNRWRSSAWALASFSKCGAICGAWNAVRAARQNRTMTHQ